MSFLTTILGLKGTANEKDGSSRMQRGVPAESPSLSCVMKENRDFIEKSLGQDSDIVLKEIAAGSYPLQALVMYTDGLTSQAIVNETILKPLAADSKSGSLRESATPEAAYQWLLHEAITNGGIKELTSWPELYLELLGGNTVILLDGVGKGLSVDTSSPKERAIEEPSSATVIRGSREGFTENLRTNTMLVRRKIRDSRLRCRQMNIGEMSKTEIAVMYMEGIAKEDVVQELFARLHAIKVPGILESGNIEEWIQDQFWTPFPTVFNTERPDMVSAALMEGRAAVVVNGTPFVLIVPALFTHFFQVAEDYYQRADIGFLIRLLRYISLLISLLAPALFIAVTTFHQEMLPTPLLISLAAQREGIPFPALIEAIAMEFTFEVLREAGVRLPRAVGQAVSIVGALVIGQAAVEAGIVSAAMVIVVSITAITSFVFPAVNMSISIRMLRFLFMILAGSFGLFGITVGLIALTLHLCSLKSFGVPYMSPFAPYDTYDQGDAIFRMPPWLMRRKPDYLGGKPHADRNR
ncbi:spore germination protein [Paenibacillus gansuensis]|uniref:Spore germination protein n=1 Tax=Paenibacillus gansuensis TaxID=306542 RepID=A0ABW5PA91_9BACL